MSAALVKEKLIALLDEFKSKCDEQFRAYEKLRNDIRNIKEMVQTIQVAPVPLSDGTGDSTDSVVIGEQNNIHNTSSRSSSTSSAKEKTHEQSVDDIVPELPEIHSELNDSLNNELASQHDNDFINEILNTPQLQENGVQNGTPKPQSRIALRRTMVHEQDTSKLPELMCICGVKFSGQPHLQSHIQRYKNPKFSCPLCSTQQHYPGANELRQHLKRIHKAYMTGYQIYGCNRCAGLFSSKRELGIHQDKHCDENKSRPSVVIVHGRKAMVDEIEEEIKCYCGEIFVSEDELNSHVQKVTATFKFECETMDCRKCFITREEMKLHLKEEHNQPSLRDCFDRKRLSTLHDDRTAKRAATETIPETKSQNQTRSSTEASCSPELQTAEEQQRQEQNRQPTPSTQSISVFSSGSIPYSVTRVRQSLQSKNLTHRIVDLLNAPENLNFE